MSDQGIELKPNDEECDECIETEETEDTEKGPPSYAALNDIIMKENQVFTSYVKPTHGNDIQVFRNLLEGVIQRKFHKDIKKLNLNFSIIRYLTLLKTPTEKVLQYIQKIGEITYLSLEFCIVKRDNYLFFFIINNDYMSDIHVDIYSTSIKDVQDGVKIVEESFKGILAKERINMELRWYYHSNNKIRNAYITEELNDIFIKESYPYLDVDGIIDGYLRSDEPLLILIGPPGTGKTRFIRYLLRKRHQLSGNVSVSFTSDQYVIEKSEIFVDYLLGDSDTLIIEDIDYHLNPRKEGNTAMYNFLTASNSIIINHVNKKKMIFSTNLSNINSIDDALMRPGRCYQVIETRALSNIESMNLVKALNREDTLTNDKYTVAEIFNPKEKPIKKKAGF